MAECSRHFSTASGYLKVATAVLILALLLHTVGFSTPSWSTAQLFEGESTSPFLWLKGSDHAGLWQICSCFEIYGSNICSCMGRHGDPVWFRITQTLETVTLVGFIVSAFISMNQLCTKQDRKLKRINIFISFGSGLSGVLGVTVYGIRSKNEIDDMVTFFNQFDMEVQGYLDFSFYICCFSVILYVFVGAPLYMKDERIQGPTIMQELPIVYNNQSQVAIPSLMQGTANIADLGQDNAGYIPPHAQVLYCPPYTVDGLQEEDLQHSQIDYGIPQKA